MKTKIERTLHSWHLSKRTLALVLSVVMLVTTICAGSVLTAIAAEFAPSEAQAVADAVGTGADNAPVATENKNDDAAEADADVEEPADDAKKAEVMGSFEENDYFKNLKEDIASVGANVDLMNTGAYGLNGKLQIMFNADSNNSGTVNGQTVSDGARYFYFDADQNEQHVDVYLKTNTSGTHDSDFWSYGVKLVNGNGDYAAQDGYWWKCFNNADNEYQADFTKDKQAYVKVDPVSTGYMHVYFTVWRDASKVKTWGANVSALTYSSISAGSTSLTPGDTTTLSSSGSGGSGDYTYTYSAKIKGTSTSVSCISGNTFTAPSVTTSTTYVVTGTMKDNKCPDLTKPTKTVEITVAPRQYYYVWGGKTQEFNATTLNSTLTYNSSTGLYDGTYTFETTDWHSILLSDSNTAVDGHRVWNSKSDVGWALDTYNSNRVYQNYSSTHKEPSSGNMSSGLLNWVEINDWGGSNGIKMSPKAANTTVNLSLDVTNKILYIWSGTVTEKVDVFAKDGAAPIDWDNKTHGGATDTAGYNSKYLYNFARVGTTTCTSSDTSATFTSYDCDINNNTSNSKYQKGSVEAGKTVTITTTIDNQTDGSTNWRSKYYVKGWSINGVTYNSSGVVGTNNSPGASTTSYSMTYTIPADTSKLPEDAAGNPCIEITPIYYLQNNSGCVTFYLEGFNAVQSTWGNTPYVFPFYGELYGYQDSFGVYPGQPMVYANGQYSSEIPINATAIKTQPSTTTVVKGITISNGYADHVHRNLIYGWSDHDNDADHKQTYDFDDFYKIYAERLTNVSGTSTNEHPNAIFFRINRETTVYNRSSYGGGKSGQFASGTSSINISTIDSSGNGWELLKNRYDQTVNIFGDHSAVSSLNPSSATEDTSNAIYVVSTGYNANIAGDYGTMWKVYNGSGQLITKDTTNSRYGIPPSLLNLAGNATNGITSTVTYTSANRSVEGVGSYTDSNSKYNNVYKQLKAANVSNKLVYVTYEKDTQDSRSNSNGTGAYRLDGQWFYTHATDSVQSTIGIEYYNNSTGKWVKDTVSAAGVGSTTGATATFDSDSYLDSSHKTTSKQYVINANGSWNFTATNGTNYVFEGWYIKYSDTSYDHVAGATETGSIKATANYSLVARYVPSTTGNLTITHAIDPASTGEGDATMTVTYGGSSQTVTVTDGVARANISGFTNSTNDRAKTVSVTITSTPKYDGKVTDFSYDDQVNVTPTEGTTPGAENTAVSSTFSFTIEYLYNSNHDTQLVNTLNYTSTIEETPHYYSFDYNFTDRAGAAKSYTSKGELSQKEYKEYCTNQANHTLDNSILAANAPFESNFLKQNTLTRGTITYTSATHTFSATSTFTQTPKAPSYTVKFKLPYDYYTAAGDGYKKYTVKPNGSNRKVYDSSKAEFEVLAKYDEFVTVGATETEAGAQTNVGKVTDATDVNHTGNDFFTAADTLTDSTGATTYYFNCWEIRRLADSNQSTAPLVSRIFYPDLNYRIYGNYYVEAKYSTDEEDYWHNKYTNSGELSECSALYLGDSRNQWNAPGSGTTTSSTTAADKIYSDFMFNFNDKNTAPNAIGYVIERVVDTSGTAWAKGSANVTDMDSYKATYGGSEETVKSAILTSLSGKSAVSGGSRKGCVFIDLDTDNLNNKNYIEDSYSVFSQYGQKVATNSVEFNTNNAIDDYVYRVYAVMKKSDGNWAISDPAYFCMRYTANLNYSE